MLDNIIFSFADNTGGENVSVKGKFNGTAIKSIKLTSVPSSSGKNLAPKVNRLKFIQICSLK